MKQETDKIERPIGAKLIIIITILLLLSLGAITILVSVMVSGDVRVTAENSNLSANRRSAQEAETFFGSIRGNTLVLLDTINAVGSFSAAAGLASDYFFERNQDIAFIGIVRNNNGSFNLIRSLVNEKFFFSNELEFEIIEQFLEIYKNELERSGAGETLLINAAPVFGISAIALFYPWVEAGEQDTAIVFFSSNVITENFTGTGDVNLSYMINDAGDYLIYSDYDLIRTGASAESAFVPTVINSADQSRQTLFTETDGKRHFGAYSKISIGNAAVITTIPYDIVMEGTVATTRRNIFLTGAVLFIAIMFVWFFSKTVSVPLKALAGAARQIENGDFNLHLTAKSKDEVGYLTKSFQKMSGALNVFGRFTNKDIAVKAMRGEIKPGGLPKHATVFFSDIRAFTAKSETFTNVFGEEASNRIVLWLNEYFGQMVDCVEKTSGVVDKFIGDAVMAHWGTAFSAGSPQEDAFNAVRAAVMMRNALHELNSKRKKDDPGDPEISIGCGLNSGIVTAGQIGSEQRMEYTVIGDPVNLASRVESLNKPLGTDILISEDTWLLTGDKFITEEMPSVTVKGKEKPIRLFAVVNLKDASGPQTLAEVRELLGIKPPDVSKVDTGAEEKKYKIGEAG